MSRFSLTAMMVLAIALAPAADASWLKFPKMPWSKTSAKTTKSAKVQTKEKARVERDVQRLESILANVKTSAKLSQKAWKSAANEAETLASRIYTNVKSATAEKDALRAAEQLRTHVQNMKKEAYQGDYRETRRHAERALSVAARLDEWAG
jgi:hypothetical protein